MIRLLASAATLVVLVGCAASYQPIDAYVPLSASEGSATPAVPPSWASGCEAVDFHGFALQAECGGRTLSVQHLDVAKSERGRRKAFEQMFPGGKMESRDDLGPGVEAFRNLSGKESGILYDLGVMVAREDKGLYLFHCATYLDGDQAYCREAIKGMMASGWSHLRPMRSDTMVFAFAGRNIETGNRCHYMGARNYQCSRHGQINWSPAPSAEEARKRLGIQERATIGNWQVSLSQSDTLPCKVEDQETECRVNTYRILNPNPMVAGSKLVAIYATAELRGKHVGLVCSFYSDDSPTLCEEVVDLKGKFHSYTSGFIRGPRKLAPQGASSPTSH